MHCGGADTLNEKSAPHYNRIMITSLFAMRNKCWIYLIHYNRMAGVENPVPADATQSPSRRYNPSMTRTSRVSLPTALSVYHQEVGIVNDCRNILEKRLVDKWRDDSLIQQLRRKALSEGGHDCFRIAHTLIKPCVGVRCRGLCGFCIKV